MQPEQYFAILGLIAGAAYLVLAAISFRRSRRRREAEENEGAGERMVLRIEEPMLEEGDATYERMRKLAAICASIGHRVFNENFDYSIESIAALDRTVVAGWGKQQGREIDLNVILSFGAYFGEVLVRRTQGHWVTGITDNDPASVFFLTPEGDTVSVSPFMLMREKFDNMYKFDLGIAYTALEQKLKELNAV